MTNTLTRGLTATALALAVLGVTAAAQQATQPAAPPIVREGVTTKISDHVYVIPDNNVPMVPNVGIVVGARATLVVDTGLGPPNAETVLREVAKVSTNQRLYLVATHFHPEHAGGASAFPPSTTFVVSNAEQQDLDELGPGMIASFSRISPAHADLLKDAKPRRGDVHFATDYRLDLGGVTVSLRAVGPTHTRGDTVVFVEPDRVLFAGDVVLNGLFLSFSAQSSASAWLRALDVIEAMKPARIVPSHGPMGDTAMIRDQRAVLLAIQGRVRDLKHAGRSADEAAQIVTTEFQAAHPTWTAPARLGQAARTIYAETP